MLALFFRMGIQARAATSGLRNTGLHNPETWFLRPIPAGSAPLVGSIVRQQSIGNPYAYALNDPSNFIDPSGLDPSELCKKALADLNSAIKGAQRRIEGNLRNPLDAGHVKSKVQAISRINNALSRVLVHCGCALGQQVAQQAQDMIDQLQQLIDSFKRAVSSQSYWQALSILLAVITLLLLLLALLGGAIALA
jgi:hydrogenase maturation factor